MGNIPHYRRNRVMLNLDKLIEQAVKTAIEEAVKGDIKVADVAVDEEYVVFLEDVRDLVFSGDWVVIDGDFKKDIRKLISDHNIFFGNSYRIYGTRYDKKTSRVHFYVSLGDERYVEPLMFTIWPNHASVNSFERIDNLVAEDFIKIQHRIAKRFKEFTYDC